MVWKWKKKKNSLERLVARKFQHVTMLTLRVTVTSNRDLTVV